MEVNEAMMGKLPQGRKNNAVIGQQQQEQQTNISDSAQRFEEVILNPLLERLFEYDQQFRTDEITVKARGELGVKAKLITIPVQQWGERYWFSWQGTEVMMGQQRLQSQIGWLNILKGIPPAMLDGRRLSVLPIIEAGTENLFGPEVAPRILIDERNQFSIDPDTENELLNNGFPTEVHEADDDTKHLQSHMRAAALTGDLAGLFKAHLIAHGQALQRKRQMQMAQQQGTPGSPGGGQQAGAAGTPRPGAVPQGPKGPQGPAGQIHPDAMVDPSVQGRG
jgi:hypothetical protein